jgi:hypothetical protein
VFTSEGEFITKWGSFGEGDGEFRFQRGVSIDCEDNVYVASFTLVQKFTSDGQFITKWGSFGTDPGEMNRPHDLAIDQVGNIYLTEPNNNRISVFERDTDSDGILDNGDSTGILGDNPCAGGETENCDDNCIAYSNPLQEDGDADGIGDVCDACPNDFENDIDNDNLCAEVDNCPKNYNPEQEDTSPPQSNGIGDDCDCESDFDCDGDVDGSDATTFKLYFGRNPMFYPCDEINPCRGDFDCDQDCDGTDASLFKSDFGRSEFNNPCPVCTVGDWCTYSDGGVENINECALDLD